MGEVLKMNEVESLAITQRVVSSSELPTVERLAVCDPIAPAVCC
jgi:hypothetical protein